MNSLGWRKIIKILEGREKHVHLTELGRELGMEQHTKEHDILRR